MRILAASTLILTLLFAAGCGKQDSDTAAVSAVAKPAEAAQQAPAAAPTVAKAEQAASEQKPAAEAAVVNADPHAGHGHGATTENAAPAVTPMLAPADTKYVEGKHYTKLDTPVKTITGDNVEVTEVFSYGCIHCFHFEPVAQNWKASIPEGAEFVQNPAVFNSAWEYYARIFYTAKALDVFNPVHEEVFKALHVGRKRLKSESDVAAIFVAAGVDEAKFKETFNSFGVSSQVQMADSRARGFGTTGTPELIIDGRYRVTSSMAGNHQGMFNVANYLIEKIKKEKAM